MAIPDKRLKLAVDSYLAKVDDRKYKSIRSGYEIVDKSFPIILAVFGIVVASVEVPSYVEISIWICVLVLAIFLILTKNTISESAELFKAEVRCGQLLSALEALACRLSMFNLVSNIVQNEDPQLLALVSSMVPEISAMSEANQSVIKDCLNQNLVVDTSRQTNIELEGLNIPGSTKGRLQEVTQQIVDVAHLMFSGYGYTAKLYLRAEKMSGNDKAQLLVALSRFPLKKGDGYGTSWVKTRGNESIVWSCLEQGNCIVRSQKGLGDYYDSVLAICLPGRAGVLAITASNLSAFERGTDKATIKALALVTRQLLVEALAI